TVVGEVYFNSCYDGNPLVNAFALGLVKRDKIFTANAEGVGNPVLYIGAKTGRDGIHGATMASEEFSEGSESKRPNTQIGDPFKEKLLLEACLELMQTDALVGIQDMGAAGLTSSAFEMAGRAGSGVIMHLDRVPLREKGITPYEIMLSESQERMLLVAQKGREQEIIDIVQKWDLDAAAIGEVTDDGYVRLFWAGEEVAAVEAAPLSDQAPMYDRPYARPEWLDKLADFDESQIPLPRDFDNTLLRLAGDISIASKRWIWEQYDHMVQVGTVVLPGSDAAVMRMPESKKGLALSSDCNSRYCYLNPREGAMHAVAESARNVAASGAMPIALTNCLNYGNPEKPEVMYQLVEGIEGIAEAAKVLNTPVVSGNVSLYNETEGKPIYPTPVIVMTGVLEDVEKRIDIPFKQIGSHILAIGKLPTTISGSHYLDVIHSTVAGKIPAVDLAFHKSLFTFMAKMAAEGRILAAHDIAEGGIAIALFEMGRANNIGCAVTLPATARADALLFGESPLMLLEVNADNLAAVTAACKSAGLDCTDIGRTTDDGLISMHTGSISHIKTEISKLDTVYEKTLVELVK
ncbi:MAG: phosphoribosylformylglycinamidine synthase subunit PurL, partial [Deferribacteraceae bacterium]|nr:phosphoribosylformylglycinamidine synthase subunit PurL [Deferribacteraceae bacterium]